MKSIQQTLREENLPGMEASQTQRLKLPLIYYLWNFECNNIMHREVYLPINNSSIK